MKIRTETMPATRKEELIAVFGEARLVRAEGRLELRGGSMSDRTEAIEWLSLFMPDQVPVLRR